MGAKAVNVDFSGVKDRGAFNTKRVAEGDYAATIVKVEDGKAKESGNEMYTFTIKLQKFSQYSYPYRCVITDNQLWKLRNIAVAAGLNVPKKRMKFDPNKLVGKSIGVTMEDDDYEGKPKSEISSVFPISELADGAVVEDDDDDAEAFDNDSAPVAAVDDDDAPEDEAEAPAPKKGKKKKGKKSKSEVEELDISDIG